MCQNLSLDQTHKGSGAAIIWNGRPSVAAIVVRPSREIIIIKRRIKANDLGRRIYCRNMQILKECSGRLNSGRRCQDQPQRSSPNRQLENNAVQVELEFARRWLRCRTWIDRYRGIACVSRYQPRTVRGVLLLSNLPEDENSPRKGGCARANNKGILEASIVADNSTSSSLFRRERRVRFGLCAEYSASQEPKY